MNWPGKSLKNNQATSMLSQITHKEIKTLFSMKSDSASAPDVFIVEFFKANQELVENDFLDAIEYFFSHNYLYYPLNTTAVSLIPKTDSPVRMKDFRPISCCNV